MKSLNSLNQTVVYTSILAEYTSIDLSTQALFYVIFKMCHGTGTPEAGYLQRWRRIKESPQCCTTPPQLKVVHLITT
jgi:hypothetical protein